DAAADPAVDADDLAAHVEQRAAAVAADQGAVGLDDGVGLVEHPAQAHDGGPARLVAAGVAGGDDPLAALQVGGAARVVEGPFALAGDLDHAAVDGAVTAQALALDALAVVQDQRDLLPGPAGDVAGRQHVAVGADDDAAAGGAADDDADGAGDDPVQDLADVV